MDQRAGWSESVRLASHFVGLDLITGLCLNFLQEFAQIYGNDKRNNKSYDIKQCKYMYSLRIQDYFECFNCLPFSLGNHFSKKLFSGMQSEHQTVWILIRSLILVGLIWVQDVCKAEDIMHRAKCYNFQLMLLTITYFNRGPEPDCLLL